MKNTSKRLPGKKLHQSFLRAHGFKKHLERLGMGDNYLRTERLSQPSVLKKGDILVTNEEIISEPREAYNGGIFIHIGNILESGFWIRIPSRIPLALESSKNEGEGKFAKAKYLEKGDILATGSRVLSDPFIIEEGSVNLHLTGGKLGHHVRVLSNIPIALLTKDDNAPEELWSRG